MGEPIGMPRRTLATGVQRSYVRFAALGDSVTHGVGDPQTEGCRGWARILANAIGNDHDISFANLARPGATAADVRFEQLAEALDHHPHLASLIVGLNDTMRSAWDPERLHDDLMHCAGRLADAGALLLTARFHDHSRVFGLPALVGRHMRQRVDVLNAIYDEIHETYGGLRVDLAAHPGIYDLDFWSIDRLHPSELGHRALAHEFAAVLDDHGLVFEAPELELDGELTRLQELRWLVSEGAPWIGRRARDLAPVLARNLWQKARSHLAQ
jgi:lysophospholipase L1-like esterase